MDMKDSLTAAFAIATLAAGNAYASSTSSILVDISFTLADVLIDGGSADPFLDYEADGSVDGGSYGNNSFALGGAGTADGNGTVSLNGTVIDGIVDPGPLAVGDTISMSLFAETVANTGFVNRDQFGEATFGFYNYSDDGLGNYQTLSFIFDYEVSYSMSLSNDVSGDQAIGELNTLVELDDYDFGTSSIDLFPSGTPDAIEALYFGAGAVTPSGMKSGSFTLDVAGGYGYFVFTNGLSTPTYIQPSVVPVPAAVWLFGSGLLGLVGFARRR